MSQNHQEQVEQILNELIKLNPFDAVIIEKKESGCIRIEMNNPKAEKLTKLIILKEECSQKTGTN